MGVTVAAWASTTSAPGDSASRHLSSAPDAYHGAPAPAVRKRTPRQIPGAVLVALGVAWLVFLAFADGPPTDATATWWGSMILFVLVFPGGLIATGVLRIRRSREKQ